MRARCAFFLLCVASLGQGAEAQEKDAIQRRFGDDVFVAGATPYVARAVKGDLVAAGGEVRLASPVGGDILAAGGQLSLDGSAARNARLAGGRVTVGPVARIEGNASIAGGRVEIRGAIGGYLQAAGGKVLIDGPVQGDVYVGAGELELGPATRIAGRLTYWGGTPLQRHASAQVAGGVEEREMVPPRERPRHVARGVFGVWTLGLMVLAAVLVAALPAVAVRVSNVERSRFAWSLLVGFLAIAAAPAAIVLLLVTVVGIPLALLAMLAFPLLLLLGYVASGIATGYAILNGVRRGRAAGAGWRAVAGATGVLVLALVALVPWIGLLVALAALMAGAGALVLCLRPSGSESPASSAHSG